MPEDHHVARHVAGEHPVQAKVANRVNDPGREGQREHQPKVRFRGLAAECVEHIPQLSLSGGADDFAGCGGSVATKNMGRAHDAVDAQMEDGNA